MGKKSRKKKEKKDKNQFIVSENRLKPPFSPYLSIPQILRKIIPFLSIIVLFSIFLSIKNPLFFFPPIIYWFFVLILLCSIIFFKINYTLEKILERAGLFLIISTFFILKTQGIHPSSTDENIYFYMAKIIGEGNIPYRDFFFAHPPLHLLIPALIFKITGFNIVVAKLIPALSSLISGIFIYLTLKRYTSTFQALLSLSSFYLSYQVLMASTDMTGVNLTVLFMTGGLYFVFTEKYKRSGIFFALSSMCGLYMFASFAGVSLFLIFYSRKYFLKFFISFIITILIIILPFIIADGEEFINGVLIYHLKKPLKQEGQLPIFGSSAFLKAIFNNIYIFLTSKNFKTNLYFHAPYYISAMITFFFFLFFLFKGISEKQKFLSLINPAVVFIEKEKGLMVLSLIISVLFLFQFSNLKEIYDFYLVLIMPFLSILLGFVLYFIGKSFYLILWSVKHGLVHIYELIFSVVIIFLFILWIPFVSIINKTLEEKGGKIRYKWTEPHGFSFLSPLVKTFFYKDFRIKGKVEPYYYHYLWNKKLTFTKVEEIAKYVEENSAPYETITGASTVAPLIALYSNRKIAGNFIDTNAKRFKAKMVSEKEFFDKICATPIKFIISTPQSFFEPERMKNHPVINRYFNEDRIFFDPYLKHFYNFPILLFKRRSEKINGEYCKFLKLGQHLYTDPNL